ncbi:MAG: ABC transporter ATP-binding protein, partial [Gemmatimonadales bacterium]|nr:ABC transporter ATP-binding protein [Gemmatimonadales bacterium]
SPPPGRIGGGSRILFEGTDLTSAGQETRRGVRGGRIGMVFQNAATSLNPVLSVGAQIRETVLAHHRLTGREARDRAVALLAETGMPDPARRYGAFPHELSGGQKQRALIAIALAGEPSLLIADEPTTALDVTVQAQILELIDRLRERRGMAVLLVTHDLGIVARRADRVVVMLAGRIVEEAPTRDLFTRPAHEYTRALLGAVPRLTGARLS